MSGSWRIGEKAKDRFDRWLRDYPRATPVAIFIVTIVLVVSAAFAVQRAGYNSREAAVRNQAGEIVSAIEQQAAAQSAFLASTSAVFSSLDTVSPDLFHQFVERLDAIHHFTGIVGMGWSEVVPVPEREAFLTRMAQEGHPNFRIYPESAADRRGALHVITMLEPRTRANLALVGYNMHSEARRAAAMDRAQRTRAVAATDPVKLLQDADDSKPSPGFLVYVPVFNGRDSKRLEGFVYSPIRTRDFVQSALDERLLHNGLVQLYDDTPAGAELIYASSPATSGFDAAISLHLSVFDQSWTLRFAPPVHSALYPFTLVVLIGGISFSLLLLAYVLLVQRRNEDLFAMIDAQTEREAERAAFVRELNHRVKNTLANVTSIISLTRRNTSDIDSFASSLLDRVRALAASHSLLDGGQWGPTDLKALVESQLSSFDKSNRQFRIDGPSLLISPNDALTVGLALHELATNAAHYGALSSEEGQVRLRWEIEEDKWIALEWIEQGGPETSPPVRRGFGLTLIERALGHELGRPVRIEFPPSGLQCTFAIPLRSPRTFRLRN